MADNPIVVQGSDQGAYRVSKVGLLRLAAPVHAAPMPPQIDVSERAVVKARMMPPTLVAVAIDTREVHGAGRHANTTRWIIPVRRNWARSRLLPAWAKGRRCFRTGTRS